MYLNSMKNRKLDFLLVGWSAILLCLLTITAEAQNSDGDNPIVVKSIAILKKIQSKWSSVETLKYQIDTKDTESEGFRASIGETNHDRDVLQTHLTFMEKGGDYGWKADTCVPATGEHIHISTGGSSNGVLSVLFQGRRSELMITKDPANKSAIPVTGCNPMMEAFSFLISDDWQGLNCPAVTLETLLSPDAWVNAAKRVTSISEEQFQNRQCTKVTFGAEGGSHDVVLFSKDLAAFPIDWRHYEGTYLRREVSLDDLVDKSLPNGNTLTLPRTVIRHDYYDPNNSSVFCTSEQTITALAINEMLSDDDLIIDPSLADTIYDRDNEKRILVPK